MDIAVTATHLLLPMNESRSEIWMLDHSIAERRLLQQPTEP